MMTMTRSLTNLLLLSLSSSSSSLSWLLLLLFLSPMAAAVADASSSPSSLTIYQTLQNSSQHSLLTTFLDLSDLTSNLSSPNTSMTLFAPTDNDFAALPTPYSYYLHSQWYIHLHILLSYHIVPQHAYTEADIFALNTSLPTSEGNDTITIFANNDTINHGATIVTADIVAINGYLQIPSRVLLPDNLQYRITDYFHFLDSTTFDYILNIFKLAASNSGVATFLYDDYAPGATLFVAPNSGFDAISEADLTFYFNSTPAAYEIAGYQVAASLIYATTTYAQPVALQMFNGYSAWLYSDIANHTTRINGATVTNTYYAKNGVVNVLDMLIRPLYTGGFLNLTTQVGAFPLDTFVTSFEKAGFLDYLNVHPSNPLTFLVPVDSAFTNVQSILTKFQQDTAVWGRHWHSLLLHHVTEGAVKTTALSSNTRSIELRMLSNYTITVDVSANENITINNNAQALVSDLAALNGVVDIIDEVLLPPSIVEPIYQQVAAEFVTLTSLIQLTGLVDALNTTEGPLTLLVPNDVAFAKVGNLANYSNDEIQQILMNHLFDANIYESDLLVVNNKSSSSNDVANLITKTWAVTVSGNNTYVGGALILNPDNLAANGVFHVIDHVLVGSVQATGATPKSPSSSAAAPGSSTTTSSAHTIVPRDVVSSLFFAFAVLLLMSSSHLSVWCCW